MSDPHRLAPAGPGSAPAPMTTTRWVGGLDAAAPSTGAADHLAQVVAAALAEVSDLVVTTHLVPAPGGFSSHLALALTASARPGGWPGAALAAAVAASEARDAAEVGLVELHPDGGTREQGLPGLRRGARHAAAQAADGVDGRAVVFPGGDELGERVTVAALLRAGAISDVVLLGGGRPDLGTTVVTRRHVRPRVREGRLVLQVQPAAGGTVVPFENPHPTPCCADH